jgi:hypothetical protein
MKAASHRIAVTEDASMKYVATICVLMFAAASFCFAAEDLGELAKKEKERREALAKQGKKGKTFTNADVKDLKATLAIEVTQTQTAPAETETSTTSDASTSTSSQTAPAPAAKTPVEQSATNPQIQQLQQQKTDLEAQIKQNRQRINDAGLLHSRGAGNLYKEIREAEARLQEIDKQIRDLQQKQQEKPQ